MSAPDPFRDLPEQAEAKRLLTAALAEGPAHAYLLHGPRGVGKRAAALAFAGAILCDEHRAERRTHPDLYVLEPLGEQIRIDDIHALRHDLHLRPFEAERRVYLVLGADLMNEDASDALLKSLEEPPPYAVVVLVADRLAPVPDTIRSRCQSVLFRRLSRQASPGAGSPSSTRSSGPPRPRRSRGSRPAGSTARRGSPTRSARPSATGCSTSPAPSTATRRSTRSAAPGRSSTSRRRAPRPPARACGSRRTSRSRRASRSSGSGGPGGPRSGRRSSRRSTCSRAGTATCSSSAPARPARR
ncbi:MAG: hypothetical protein R3C15_13350 [Thermoleophilia bacterium]